MHIRYFVINEKTEIMHIQGLCEHTKPRSVPIRLFEDIAAMESYAGRSLRLCKVCEKKLAQTK